VLRFHLILMQIRIRIRILDPHWKKNGWTIQKWGNFYNLFFSKVQSWVIGVKKFFLQFLVDILPLGSGSVDPHIFADPDPGSQNLGDPTDPDPKRWKNIIFGTAFNLSFFKDWDWRTKKLKYFLIVNFTTGLTG